jgi:4-amino-4-deoxy-L-arabinose transferase-like glycosyltransferase
MRTAEPAATAGSSRERPGAGLAARRGRAPAWVALALILAAALGLRVWGVRQGLPFAYNADEADHFVPHAVRMFQEGTLNPHYFSNPPGYTYMLHFAFAIWFGGGGGAIHAYHLHPQDVYTLARVIAGLLGTAAVWLTYVFAARLLGRGAGLLAAALLAVAFLPVFYAHLALNDAPTLAPLTLSLVGSAGVLRRGAVREHVIAGVGLGLACAFKYTAGIVVVPYVAAVAARWLAQGDAAGRTREAALGLLVGGAGALAAFLIANPYAILDYGSFHRELAHQSSLSAESQGKLGAPRSGGLVYYLWSLGWGFGWAPAVAALGGAVAIWLRRRDRAIGWMLVPAPLLFLAFMGLQGRYFGRWLMPILPLVCVLAAYLAVSVWAALRGAVPGAGSRPRRVPARRGMLASVALAVIVAGLLAQGAVHGVHNGLVLSRADTRTIARRWMIAHVPAGTPIVAEPISPNEWANESSPGTSTAANPPRWIKYPSLLPRISPAGALLPRTGPQVSIEDYVRTLAPALIGYYEQHRYCWVLTGSTESGRAFADPAAVPLAVAYYRALERRGEVVFRSSPYRRGAGEMPFGFDWSFDYYPLAYERPGPLVTVYRLRGGRCS